MPSTDSQHPRPLRAGRVVPKIQWRTAQGSHASTRAEGWCLFVVYRGEHCPVCKRYLIGLNGLRESFEEAGISVFAVSADSKPAAANWLTEMGLNFPLAYGLTPAQMEKLGLYVSPADDEVDHAFAEPAVFALRDSGKLHFACVGNAPYGRPPLHDVLEGLKRAIEEGLPPHGTG